MIKKNKATLIVTTLVLLIPVLVGLLLWEQLPDRIPTHWNVDGEIDGWSGKGFAVFALPAILLVLHWVCILASHADPSSKNYHPKMIRLVLWICPVIGLVLCALVYTAALGYSLSVERIMPLLVGLMFLIMGNLLPKCRQSYTMGIKLPWTLHNEENWNKTHRFGGKVWVLCGAVTMATAFVGNFWILIGVLVVAITAPTLYSYCLYRKQQKNTQ